MKVIRGDMIVRSQGDVFVYNVMHAASITDDIYSIRWLGHYYSMPKVFSFSSRKINKC